MQVRRVRNEAPEIKERDVIMRYLVRAVTCFRRLEIDECGAIVE
jgi:hypothetical protein